MTYLVANPKDRFSDVEAQIIKVTMGMPSISIPHICGFETFHISEPMHSLTNFMDM